MMTRVGVADDHPVVRDGLITIIGNERDLSLAWASGTGKETIDCFRNKPVDVLLLDFRMPDMDGFQVMKEIRNIDPAARILIITMHNNVEYAQRLLNAGASGFIVKDASTEELRKAIRIVAKGDKYVSPAVSEGIAIKRIKGITAKKDPSILSNRELQVLTALAEGKKPKEVAESLDLSYSTIENHRQRILAKLGLRNNSDLTRFAIRWKLIVADR